jgi:polyisoprenoid-binding protein YceI
MKTQLRSLLALSLLSTAVVAAPTTFDFKDPKGVNNIVFQLDAPLESINGTATGISGTVAFDPANPASLTGKLNITASSLHVGNPMMKEHMHGEMWLDVAKHPEITFEVTKVEDAKTADNVTTAKVTGKLTIKGVTQTVTTPVKLTYLKDKLKARGGNKEGDLLVLRANFTIKRSDFNINKGNGEDKVSDEIQLSLSLAGAAPR